MPQKELTVRIVTVLLFDDFTALDALGPAEVLAREVARSLEYLWNEDRSDDPFC